MADSKNPGALPGTEIVFVEKPFGGWVSSAVQILNPAHYVASVEGVQGALAKETANQYAESDGVTLFHLEKFGYLSPGPTYGAITDAGGGSPQINQLPLNGASDYSAGTAYAVLKNGRIVRINTIGTSTAGAYDPFNGTLGQTGSGTDHTGHTIASTNNPDLVIMADLATPNVEWVLSSWEDNTDADVMAYSAFNGGTIYDGWYSDINQASVAGVGGSNGPILHNSSYALFKGVPHKMCKGPDGNLYILNGSYVEQVIINAGMSAAVVGLELNLGPGWVATGIVAYNNYVAILASSSPQAGLAYAQTAMFLWTGISSTVNGVTSVDPQFIFPVPDNFGNAVFYDGNILCVLSNGRNNSSKIFQFTGKAFKKVFETPFISPSSFAAQGSIESYQDSLIIGTTKNSLARICRFYGGGFHDEGTLTDGTNNAASVGMVKNLFENWIFAGIKQGTTYSIYNSNLGANYQLGSAFRTILFTQGILGRRMYPLGFKGTVNRFQLYLAQWGTGASIYLSLFKDFTTANPGGSTDLLNVLIDTNTAVPNGYQAGTNYFGGTGYVHYAYPVGTTEIDITDIALADISSFYMIISWSHAAVTNTAAIIRSMVVDWAPSQ